MAGRKIRDMGGYPHTSDMLMKSKTNVKHYTSGEGAGALDAHYPDTDEHIKADQGSLTKKIKAHGIKPGYRN